MGGVPTGQWRLVCRRWPGRFFLCTRMWHVYQRVVPPFPCPLPGLDYLGIVLVQPRASFMLLLCCSSCSLLV